MAEEVPIPKRDEYCCVPQCNGNARLHKELSFHKIPSLKKPDLRRRWIIAIRRDEGPLFKIGGNTVVCSRHFKTEDFRWTLVRKCLKPDAVPSVFQWTGEVNTRKPPKERTSQHKKVLAEIHVPSSSQELQTSDDLHDENLPEVSSDENKDPHIECSAKLAELQKILEDKESEIKAKNEEIEALNKKLTLERFGINRFSFDNEMVEFYTGFPSYALFLTFYNAIKPTALRMKSVYYSQVDELSSRGRPKAMDSIDELFMFLCRLKCGFLSDDLSVRFNIHKSTVSRKNITWGNYMYFLLGGINIWPSREKILQHMPNDFKVSYPKTRIIIDCTEIFSERPSSLALASKTFSTYKSHNTWKGLVGIAPNGSITFISSLYSGCMSDVEITKRCGLIELMETGDQIMADKGFVLNNVLKDTGISVATPHFLCADGQFTASQIEDNQKIASLRIHVERHIKRVKEYKLLQSTVPLSIAGSVNQLWTVANLLTLFRRPLIKQKK
ncbi:uncharacterized protein LOC125661232 [Ostrea edulis]|uniref:uncharacterized protein LOC125661232 n=1 Tax=Ostrea edulis TaxID=37623 RepID=UPI0020949A00|nr:uncharacterized protein LOC125661232 [Ostrea edulis]